MTILPEALFAGDEVEKDERACIAMPTQAAAWFRLAAEQRHSNGPLALRTGEWPRYIFPRLGTWVGRRIFPLSEFCLFRLGCVAAAALGLIRDWSFGIWGLARGFLSRGKPD